MAWSLSSLDEALPKSASLLGLAVEIRSEILKHLFEGVTLHVSSHRARRPSKTFDDWLPTYSYFVCCDLNDHMPMTRDKTGLDWVSTPGGYACEYKNLDWHWHPFRRERDDRQSRRFFHMSIAKANRQLYEESIWAFLQYNTFSFCEPVAWQQFRDDHTAEQLNHMRAIELFTMTPEADPEKRYGEGDPYARTPDDHYWKFDDVGILKNVTKLVLGLRDPTLRYGEMPNQRIEFIGQALDSAFGDLSGLKRLKEAKVFIISDKMTNLPGIRTNAEKDMKNRLPVLAANLEAKLLAFNPHNIAHSTHQGETQGGDLFPCHKAS